MTNGEFIEFYSKKVKIGPELSKKLVEEFLGVLEEAIVLHDDVPLKGIMKIKKKELRAGEYRNPSTGEKIVKPRRKSIKAVFSEKLKQRVFFNELSRTENNKD